ncbi:unnamed protein product, partial [Polarella glacialis]
MAFAAPSQRPSPRPSPRRFRAAAADELPQIGAVSEQQQHNSNHNNEVTGGSTSSSGARCLKSFERQGAQPWPTGALASLSQGACWPRAPWTSQQLTPVLSARGEGRLLGTPGGPPRLLPTVSDGQSGEESAFSLHTGHIDWQSLVQWSEEAEPTKPSTWCPRLTAPRVRRRRLGLGRESKGSRGNGFSAVESGSSMVSAEDDEESVDDLDSDKDSSNASDGRRGSRSTVLSIVADLSSPAPAGVGDLQSFARGADPDAHQRWSGTVPPLPTQTAVKQRHRSSEVSSRQSMSSRSSKESRVERPVSPLSVCEARLERSLHPKGGTVSRGSGLAEALAKGDKEEADFARYRVESSQEFQERNRKAASRWRERHEKKQRIAEMRWMFQDPAFMKKLDQAKVHDQVGRHLNTPVQDDKDDDPQSPKSATSAK